MALFSCPNCGKNISDLSDRCIFCDFEIKNLKAAKICPDCGKKCSRDARFCDGCGRPLNDVENGHSNDEEVCVKKNEVAEADDRSLRIEELTTEEKTAVKSGVSTKQNSRKCKLLRRVKIFFITLLVLVVVFFALVFITVATSESSSSSTTTTTTQTEKTALENEYEQKIAEMTEDEKTVANAVDAASGGKVYSKKAEDGRYDTYVLKNEYEYREFEKPVRCVKEIFIAIEQLSRYHSDIMTQVGNLHLDCQVMKDKLATTEVDMRAYYDGISISGTSTTGEVGNFTFQQVQEYIDSVKQQQEDAKRKAVEDAYNKGVEKFTEIYRAYKSNELTADDKYKEKDFTVAGTINGISDDGIVNFGGITTVTMTTTVDNTVCYWYARFESDKKDSIKSHSVGDNITLKGKCLGWSTFTECEIL